MLGAMMSKAGIGLAALLALGGIERLPSFAGRMPELLDWQAFYDQTRPLALPVQPALTLASRQAGPGLADAHPLRPVLRGEMVPGDACDRDVSQADWVVPGDAITLRVFVAAASGSERFERRDLSGTFAVDLGGQIALPGIGRLPAAERPLACLETPVVTALESEMGIIATVTATFASRPAVLIRGSVIAPGSYDYTPNLTVAALLAKAGAGGSSADSIRRRALDARGQELRSLHADLLLKSARLSAQRRGAQALDLSQARRDVLRNTLGPDRIDSETAVLIAAQQERALRRARDASTRADLEAVLDMALQRQNLVRHRFDALSHQRDALERELAKACRGRCGPVRRYDELRLDSLSNRLSDLDLTLQDAQTRVTQARHAIVSHDRSVALSLAEAENTQARAIAETLGQLNALEAQIAAVESQILDLGGSAGRIVRVERQRGGDIVTFDLQDNDPLLPGDIVTVTRADEAQLAAAKGRNQ